MESDTDIPVRQEIEKLVERLSPEDRKLIAAMSDSDLMPGTPRSASAIGCGAANARTCSSAAAVITANAMTAAATILFWSGICSAISYLIAVPIAARIGLINTMVFTHLPSNILLALVPFAPDLTIAIVLLLARSALSQMDVPTRASYVMAVVAPEERPAAASVTAVPKTFAWAAGSLISGYLLTLSSFGWPLLIGGVVKGVYDILLLIKFQKVHPPEEQALPEASA